MPSTPAYNTNLFPKRGDITGSNEQAFGKGKDVLNYIIGGIKANTIAAICNIAPGTSIIQYRFAPKIHHDLGGTPTLIIGNASNKLGEFSCVAMPLAYLKLFGCITRKDKVDAMMLYKLDFKNDALVNTDWHDSGTTYVGLLLPNFFILYFGQKPPTGDVMSDAVKLAFSKVGTGYETWCIFAEASIYSSLKIATVLSNAASEVNHDTLPLLLSSSANIGQEMGCS